mgnify:CR=1 FL=1
MAGAHLGYFAPDYRSARDGFVAAGTGAGAVVDTFENPAPGPDGSPVFTDVARLGRADAKLMGVCSGIANYFGWDVTLVRVAWVLAALFGIGAPFLIYLAIGLIAD